MPAIAPTPALDSQGSSPFSQHCCDTEVRCTQLVPVYFSPNLCSQVTRSTTAVECKAGGSSLLQIWKQLVMFSFAFKIRQNSSVSNEGPQGLSHLPPPPLFPSSPFVMEVSLSLSLSPSYSPISNSTRPSRMTFPPPGMPSPPSLFACSSLALLCFQTSPPWPQPHHQIVIKQVCVH